MGAEIHFPAQAPMGKPVVRLSIREGYRRWADTYDRDPNPLLALEERVAAPLLGIWKACASSISAPAPDDGCRSLSPWALR